VGTDCSGVGLWEGCGTAVSNYQSQHRSSFKPHVQSQRITALILQQCASTIQQGQRRLPSRLPMSYYRLHYATCGNITINDASTSHDGCVVPNATAHQASMTQCNEEASAESAKQSSSVCTSPRSELQSSLRSSSVSLSPSKNFK
jgi:hypothetical protein